MDAIYKTQMSLFTPCGYQCGGCGYCKNEQTGRRTSFSRASYYAESKSMSPEHYQILMDRGWRRSGTTYYLPDAARSCCPHYTIRLPTKDFVPCKDQRQTLNRWSRYVLGEEYMKRHTLKYPRTKEQKKLQNNTFVLEDAVHGCEESAVDVELQPEHTFTVTLEHDDFTKEKFMLFKDYQQHVHHESADEITTSGFRRFLCSSSLQRRTHGSKKLGTFHQCYRLDGRLIAMAVLDLLPHAVSGVYFIYHHDYEKWSLGKLSALREATLAREGGYEYYYMGYYIHGCEKMRYKAAYKPQYFLDYESGGWSPLDEARELMDKHKYVSLSAVQQRGEAELKTPWQYDSPSEASRSGQSLLRIGMPGVLSMAQITGINLDGVAVLLRADQLHQMQHLVGWDESEDDSNNTTIKGLIAEFVACIGAELAKDIVVDFSR